MTKSVVCYCGGVVEKCDHTKFHEQDPLRNKKCDYRGYIHVSTGSHICTGTGHANQPAQYAEPDPRL